MFTFKYYRFEKTYYAIITYSILQTEIRSKTRSRKTNNIENIWFFRILIDLIFWQNLVKSEKFEFAFFASMHVRRIRCIIFFIDFSIIFNFWHRIDIFYEFFTVKSHRYRFIDVANNIWKFWNSQWYYMMWFAFSFVIAKFKHKIFAQWCNFHSIINIKIHIDVLFRRNIQNVAIFQIFDRTFYNSILRHIWNTSNFDSFVFAVFASMYDLIFQNLRYIMLKKFVRKLQTIYRWKSQNLHRWKNFLKSHRWKNHIVEKVCTKISNWIR